MNPFDFVRVDLKAAPQLRPYTPHDRFTGLSGRIIGEITTLSPTFIKHSGQRQQKGIALSSAHNRSGQAILPGSSLKGLFRSLVETVGGCWWWLCDSPKLPTPLQSPKSSANLDRLDAACRLFGFLAGGKHVLGNVNFDDAVCVEKNDHRPVYTRIHDSPKPRHSAWYFPGGTIAGRKFYFHHKGEIAWDADQRMANNGGFYNSRITPLASGSTFVFNAQYTNVAADDLALLLYAIQLEPAMRHKIGFGKAMGLGSIYVRITELVQIDMRKRYTNPGISTHTFTGDALTQELATLLRPYTTSNNITLTDLRRIWAWPAVHELRYPAREWFEKNGQTPISQTP